VWWRALLAGFASFLVAWISPVPRTFVGEAAVGLAAALFVSNMYLAGRLRRIEEVLNGALDREDHRAR
jgi:hypothetical protein